MISAPGSSSSLRLVAVAGLAVALACSGSEGGDDAPSADTVSGDEPASGSRLPDSQLGQLERETLGLTLPWTRGRISRDPGPDTAITPIRSVSFSRTENVDRMVLEFGREAPFPGYMLESSVSSVPGCGSTGDSIRVQGQGLLRVRVRNATAGEGVAASDVREPELDNVTAVHGSCVTEDYVEWILDVQRATYYRTVEASNPPRLVVDVMQEVPEDAPGRGGGPSQGGR